MVLFDDLARKGISIVAWNNDNKETVKFLYSSIYSLILCGYPVPCTMYIDVEVELI